MPQPLSRVKPNATVRQRPAILDHLPPHYAQLVAAIFSFWSLIEYRLSLLLVRILGADAEPALAMFSTLTAQHLQMGALEAAAKASLKETEYDVFKATLSVASSVQTPVSYTHLDVYKRQLNGSATWEESERGDLETTIKSISDGFRIDRGNEIYCADCGVKANAGRTLKRSEMKSSGG